MFRKLSFAEKQEKRSRFKANPIYSIMYTPLWRQRGGDLCPEEVWAEGNNLASALKEGNREESKLLVQEAFDDLCQHYLLFIDEYGEKTSRTHQQAEHSAMMVAFTAFLLLLNVYPEREGHPFCTICDALADVCRGIDGVDELYEGVRLEEDEREQKGQFVETADFIEQIAYREGPISDLQAILLHQAVEDFVSENKSCDLLTMKENERLLSRANDKNGHCIQSELDLLRSCIKEKEGEHDEQKNYKNYIFAPKFEDKVSEIRQAIYPFLKGDGYHIYPKEQRQWLSIIQPIKLIDGLLIKHETPRGNKDCTDGNICTQMEEFFKEDIPGLDFSKLAKSISDERKKWREAGVGLTFEDWGKYVNEHDSNEKYWPSATIARSVYGQVKRVIKG